MESYDRLIDAMSQNRDSGGDWTSLGQCLKAFANYFQFVNREQIHKMCDDENNMNQNQESESLFAHCIESCTQLNLLCDRYGVARICAFDTEDHDLVKRFIFVLIYDIWRKGRGSSAPPSVKPF